MQVLIEYYRSITPARIREIVKGKRGISADTALRLARYFGTDAQSWLNLQQQHDIHCAQNSGSLGKALAASLVDDCPFEAVS